MGKMSSKQMRKVEQIKPFGRSRAPIKMKICHILTIFPILGKLTHIGLAGSLGALLIGYSVVVACGLYLARHLSSLDFIWERAARHLNPRILRRRRFHPHAGLRWTFLCDVLRLAGVMKRSDLETCQIWRSGTKLHRGSRGQPRWRGEPYHDLGRSSIWRHLVKKVLTLQN